MTREKDREEYGCELKTRQFIPEDGVTLTPGISD
jgi:hypothetical protein